MPRQARTASPIRPRIAPTAINTVPSGTFVVCMYGAFAVGGTVTTAPDVEVEDEEVESVVVETDDVVDVLSLEVEVEVEEDDDEEEVVVVDDMVVDVVDVEEVVLEVDFDVDVDEEEDEVVLALEVLSVVEGSAVVWAASVVAEVVASFAGSATTREAMASSTTKRKMNDGWAVPSPRRESLITFSVFLPSCPICKWNRVVLHSGSAGVVGGEPRGCTVETENFVKSISANS